MSELTTSFRASKLDEWEIEAAKKLKTLFEQADISQKLAGAAWGIGTAGMVSQYVNGKRPLGLQAAIKFSKGLKVSVAEISPTLAAQLPQLAFNSPNEAQKQPQVLIQSAPSAIKSIANEGTDDNNDLVAALRAFGLRLETADETAKRRVRAVLNDLVDDPANAESLLPMLNAALTVPAPSKRRAA